LDLDESDVEYLTNSQVIYVSDGKNFSNANYLNEYEFIKNIKSGGYGMVYLGKILITLARNLITNETMAIKKVDLTNLQQEECYNIHREALYLESLKHKNIIRFTHSFIIENDFYNVMEYAKGGELNAYISDKKLLAEAEAKKIFIQLHDAVKYIHSKNVIHRDLKPNNILFLDDKKESIVVSLSFV
jgi:serine/threonine protein kinase